MDGPFDCYHCRKQSSTYTHTEGKKLSQSSKADTEKVAENNARANKVVQDEEVKGERWRWCVRSVLHSPDSIGAICPFCSHPPIRMITNPCCCVRKSHLTKCSTLHYLQYRCCCSLSRLLRKWSLLPLEGKLFMPC